VSALDADVKALMAEGHANTYVCWIIEASAVDAITSEHAVDAQEGLAVAGGKETSVGPRAV